MTPAEIIIAALTEAGEDPANVQVWDAKPKDPLLRMKGANRVARALRDIEGREIIIYDKTYPDGLEPMLQHEAAHIVAWRRHGEQIREHGPEFIEICRQLVKDNPMKYCKKE
jgi:hypothetical protein